MHARVSDHRPYSAILEFDKDAARVEFPQPCFKFAVYSKLAHISCIRVRVQLTHLPEQGAAVDGAELDGVDTYLEDVVDQRLQFT